MSQHFQDEINLLRKEKDSFFRADPDSPIPPGERSKFKGLTYYPPDSAYKVSARLTRFERPEPVMVTMSKGSRQAYLRYGTFSFELRGKKLKLFVYKSAEDPYAKSLFVPFSDATSGHDTYGAGRYLDLEEHGGDVYDLDFNVAYNPFCAYNDGYICPIPLSENKLPVEILAGERNYK